jgi:uncharacterized coiled-coil protein SlyX
MSEFPWGVTIMFALFVVVGIMAVAEGLSRQRSMQQAIKELSDSVQEIRDALKSVSSKTKEQLSHIHGRLEAYQPSSAPDRRLAERRKSNADWMVDSDFGKSR